MAGLYQLGGERTAPYFIAPAVSGKYTETVNLQFRKGTAIAPSAVTGFTESDLTVTNDGEIVSGSFTKVSDGNYTFKVRSNPWPGSVTVSSCRQCGDQFRWFGNHSGYHDGYLH